MACDKDSSLILDETSNIQISVRSSDKVDVCHFSEEDQSYQILSINKKAWAAHEKHGDVIDSDGDDYFASENGCGLPVDCDDNDASVQDCDCPCFSRSDLEQVEWPQVLNYDPLYDCCGGGVHLSGYSEPLYFVYARYDVGSAQLRNHGNNYFEFVCTGLTDQEVAACERLIEDYAENVLNLPEEGCIECD